MPASKRNSILCPTCNRLISSDEPRCPHCGTRHPGAWWKNNLLARRILQPDGMLRAAIGLNIAMFILSLAINSRLPEFTLNPFHILSPKNRSLLFMGATGTIPIDRFGRFWTLISAMYLHGGLIHILFNMIALYQIAPIALREYGPARTSVIYTLGGTAAFWISYRAGVAFTIGASGAICALLGALIYYGKSRGGIYGSAVYRHIGGWAVAILIFGFLVPGINNWAHGGGFLAGMALGLFLGYREKRPLTALDKALAAGCVVLTLGILFWAAGTGLYYRFQFS